MFDEPAIVKRQSIIGYVAAWNQITETIIDCFKRLSEAQEQFETIYKYSNIMPYHHSIDLKNSKATIDRLKIDFWKGMIEKMEVKRFMSSQEIKKLDDKISKGEDLPEISEENIFKMIQAGVQNIDTMIEGLIKSVFNFLRPCKWDKKKTNEKFCQEIGLKVIKHWQVEKGYSSKWRVRYHCENGLRDVERAFMVLDGRGSITKSYKGNLVDTIEQSETGIGETEYFQFKCYHNGNLHLTFKRADLVQKMNAMIGKNILKSS